MGAYLRFTAFVAVVACGLGCAGVARAQAQAPSNLDGEIYLSEEAAREATVRAPVVPGYFPPYGDEAAFQFSQGAKGTRGTIYQRQIARWKDPLTLPHSRAQCVKWASGHIPFDGDWKTCIGWKIQWQWMYVTAYLRVTTANLGDIGKDVDECLADAAVAGALAAIVTGGAAALDTFAVVMKGCLVTKLPDIVSVTAYTTAGWGPWE